jgi:hypothetical protein
LLNLDSDNDLIGDWTYQVGDRLFGYGIGGGSWANGGSLFVCKRNGKIYYQFEGNEKLIEDRLPKFQEYFNINPLS